MWNWENKVVGDMYYSRIIASYQHALRVTGEKYYHDEFEDWLRSTGALTEDQIHEVSMMAENGKLEWQGHAIKFIQSRKIVSEKAK